MKLSLLIFSTFAITAVQSQTFEYLDINQVKAHINSGNDLHWNPSGGFGGYEVPKGSNRYYGGPASLWIGGLDAGGQLKLAGQTYHQSGVDFFPGPLSTVDASTTASAVSQYNRVWKLNKADIDAFILNFANGNVQNGSYTPVADLLSWPGNGDINQNQDLLLAPFVDTDGDMIYNPAGSGDYPLIKGDQAIYTIFNDNYQPHQGSGGLPIGVEIRLMAYAYGPCSVVNSNSFLNYTTFYNYQIINRSPYFLLNTYASLFNDSDIGYGPPYFSDYVGCDVQDDYGYTYNPNAANNPAIGVIQLKGPYNTTNAIDDDNDGTIDEPAEEMGMTRFMYMNNALPGVPASQTDPATPTEFFQYMTGSWKDGMPLTCGGQGYGGSVPAAFAYPSNTFSTSPCGSMSWMETGSGSDKRFVLSSGPFTLAAGGVWNMEYAYITAFDSITNNPLGKLESDVQSLKSIYNTTLNQCLTTGVKEQNMNEGTLVLFPNPASDFLHIETSLLKGKIKLEIVDALGKIIHQEEYKELTKTDINISYLSQGIYVIKLISEENTLTKKFVKD